MTEDEIIKEIQSIDIDKNIEKEKNIIEDKLNNIKNKK